MKKILLIEDEADISEVVKLILEDEGYAVSVLGDADHFETKLRESNADLVLLDLNIGGFNGKIICEYMKNDTVLKSIPVILMSANINIKQIKEECGAEDLIMKPFDLNFLISKVEEYA